MRRRAHQTDSFLAPQAFGPWKSGNRGRDSQGLGARRKTWACAKGLAYDISGPALRVHKYSHRIGEVFNFDRREYAVLCVLMLRGPQTVGELRGRTDRLYTFDDLTTVEATLNRLAERTPPLVIKLVRQPGEKEPRFAHLLSGEPAVAAPQPVRESPPLLEERVIRLEEELARLRREFEDFRRSFE